jgi:hypothetical protein
MRGIPPITVILPARNAESTIAAAVASTLNQTYQDFELWVIENGSNDRTVEVARSFTDPRLRVFELGHVGIQDALQYGIENTRSQWLARMDADDVMFPNRLEIQMDYVKRHPEVAFVGTAYALLMPFGHILEPVIPSRPREVTKELLALSKRFFGDPTIVFNRGAALAVGGADLEFPKVDGVPLLFRLLTKGKGFELPEHLHLYRIQPYSLSRRPDHGGQGRLVRLKYAPEYAFQYKEPKDPLAGGWRAIAALELQAGQGEAVRQAVKILRSEAPRTGRRMWVLSHMGIFGRALYSWRYPSRRSHRRRQDWERLFAPLLRKGLRTSTPKLLDSAIL